MAIVYTSFSGNTEGLAEMIANQFKRVQCEVFMYREEDFSMDWIKEFDIFVIGTFTWGSGDIPDNMKRISQMLENTEYPKLVTGIFGTGDRFFPHFCGAVDQFRDILKWKTKLAVTLKVELFPQQQDEQKCIKFVEKCLLKTGEPASCP